MLGYIVSVTTPNGYGGDIQVAIGINKDGKIAGTQILAIDETPGLGMNAKGEFIEQFTGKKVEGFVHTKNGASKENEIDAITSATITTEAVTGAINAGLAFVNEQILEGTEDMDAPENTEDIENVENPEMVENNNNVENVE